MGRGEAVQILTAAVNNLTQALDELTTAHVRNMLEVDGPNLASMETLRASQRVQRFRADLLTTLANSIRAWTWK